MTLLLSLRNMSNSISYALLSFQLLRSRLLFELWKNVCRSCQAYRMPWICSPVFLHQFFWVLLNLHLIVQSFFDAIFLARISFPLLFTYSWPDSSAFLHLFAILVGLLIGYFLKIGLFFDGCTAFSTLSMRSFIQDLTSSLVFFSIRISLIM